MKARKGAVVLANYVAFLPNLRNLLGCLNWQEQKYPYKVVKQLWTYIREKILQDRRNINCDEPLCALFAVDCINIFQMNKALSKHIWPLDSNGVVPVESALKEKQRMQERGEEPDEPKRKEKRQKREKSGFLAPLQLSDALIKFLGTGESALSRAEVVKRMWEYIKQNNLQDPSDEENNM